MITYCTGNPITKRSHFRIKETDKIVSVDNDEVVATFVVGKNLYSVIGTIPFGNMSVAEHINYQKSLSVKSILCDKKIKSLLKLVGLKQNFVKVKLNKLSIVEYRAVSLASKITDSVDTIYLNFDALEYSRKNKFLVRRLFKTLDKKYRVYVAITDTRFVPMGGSSIHYTENGIESRHKKAYIKVVNKTLMSRKLRYLGLMVDTVDISKIVKAKI